MKTKQEQPFQTGDGAISADGIHGIMHLVGFDIIGNPRYEFRFEDRFGNHCRRKATCPHHYQQYKIIA